MEIEFLEILEKIFTILVIPLVAGVTFSTRLPEIAKKIKGPIGTLSFLILVVFMVVAFSKNIDVFLAYYQYIIVLVLIHNALAFGVGYGATIETGIQNSGLSLAIIFSVFDGNGGMALLAAWWGIWHIFAGTIISFFFKRANAKTV